MLPKCRAAFEGAAASSVFLQSIKDTDPEQAERQGVPSEGYVKRQSSQAPVFSTAHPPPQSWSNQDGSGILSSCLFAIPCPCFSARFACAGENWFVTGGGQCIEAPERMDP
jgi:hypothetical protein